MEMGLALLLLDSSPKFNVASSLEMYESVLLHRSSIYMFSYGVITFTVYGQVIITQASHGSIIMIIWPFLLLASALVSSLLILKMHKPLSCPGINEMILLADGPERERSMFWKCHRTLTLCLIN